jgi:transposase InsO family protein
MIIHSEARTTPQIRAEIKASTGISQVALANKYNVSRQTISKWQKRDKTTDRSHRPDQLQTTLSSVQEDVVVELRRMLFLPLDDLLVITKEFINDKATRSGLHRTLVRYGLSNLNKMRKMLEEASGEKKPKKSFKDYEPGFIHIDIKYLPKMKDETSRSYLFVAIDRATRWVHLAVFPDKTAHSAQCFLQHVIDKAPFNITKLLTDNGKEFTDRYIPNGEREPTGNHAFDKVCTKNNIEHRLTKPAYPQTNGMVERFNGRISEIVKTTHFNSAKELQDTMINYLRIYNHHIPQRNIGHLTPIQKLKEWHGKFPKLFKKLFTIYRDLISNYILFLLK